MKEKDNISHKYMSNPERFADVFNYYVYKGKQIINPENLFDKDASERILLKQFGKSETFDKLRDILKMCTIMSDDKCTMVVMGIENQSEIHYAMSVRNMLYDAINYSNQVEAITAKHHRNKDLKGSAEFLSGITSEDKLFPVITLVINWGKEKWTAPKSIIEMINPVDDELKQYISDYRINVLDPHNIEDFDKFNTELAEVFELIKRQNEIGVFNDIKKKKGNEWTMSSESIDILNNFAGTRISTKELKSEGGRVKMSRLTQDLIDEGLDKGIAGAIVILKNLGLDEKSIIKKITEQYKITEEKAKSFL